MIGQAYAPPGQLYNVIILAGGDGTRMGTAADFIPKALTQLGESRAIDHIIDRHMLLAHKFIIATCSHADILEGYVKGAYPDAPIEFSRTRRLETPNNGYSALYALDHVDSRYGVILTFCDLFMIEPCEIRGDAMYLATDKTKGRIGKFRHFVPPAQDGLKRALHRHKEPQEASAEFPGVMGYFVFRDCLALKAIAYRNATFGLQDFTENIAGPYFESATRTPGYVEVAKAIEFGTCDDLTEVRKLWEWT